MELLRQWKLPATASLSNRPTPGPLAFARTLIIVCRPSGLALWWCPKNGNINDFRLFLPIQKVNHAHSPLRCFRTLVVTQSIHNCNCIPQPRGGEGGWEQKQFLAQLYGDSKEAYIVASSTQSPWVLGISTLALYLTSNDLRPTLINFWTNHLFKSLEI